MLDQLRRDVACAWLLAQVSGTPDHRDPDIGRELLELGYGLDVEWPKARDRRRLVGTARGARIDVLDARLGDGWCPLLDRADAGDQPARAVLADLVREAGGEPAAWRDHPLRGGWLVACRPDGFGSALYSDSDLYDAWHTPPWDLWVAWTPSQGTASEELIAWFPDTLTPRARPPADPEHEDPVARQLAGRETPLLGRLRDAGWLGGREAESGWGEVLLIAVERDTGAIALEDCVTGSAAAQRVRDVLGRAPDPSSPLTAWAHLSQHEVERLSWIDPDFELRERPGDPRLLWSIVVVRS